MSIRQALPLVPLQQVLGRGMAVFLTSFSFGFTVFAVLALGYALWFARRGDVITQRIEAETAELKTLESN